MKFTSIISEEEKLLLKKKGEIPLKQGDRVIGKAYIDENGVFTMETFEDLP